MVIEKGLGFIMFIIHTTIHAEKVVYSPKDPRIRKVNGQAGMAGGGTGSHHLVNIT